MPTLEEQEQFDSEVVEAVTGIKSATLRQWEAREIYICEMRRNAAFQLGTTVSWEPSERRSRRARETLRKYEAGWRSYTIGDLIRISLIRRLMRAGCEAKEAGHAAMRVMLLECDPKCRPSGREAIRKLHSGAKDTPDEYFVFFPHALHLENPFVSRRWDRIQRAIVALEPLAPARAGFILNLSVIRRGVLVVLEEHEREKGNAPSRTR